MITKPKKEKAEAGLLPVLEDPTASLRAQPMTRTRTTRSTASCHLRSTRSAAAALLCLPSFSRTLALGLRSRPWMALASFVCRCVCKKLSVCMHVSQRTSISSRTHSASVCYSVCGCVFLCKKRTFCARDGQIFLVCKKKGPHFCTNSTFQAFYRKSALRATRNRHHFFCSKRGSVPILGCRAPRSAAGRGSACSCGGGTWACRSHRAAR